MRPNNMNTAISAEQSKAYRRVNSDINELTSLYEQYMAERAQRANLIHEITGVNDKIKSYIEHREHSSYILFSGSDSKTYIASSKELLQKTMFLSNVLKLINQSNNDIELRMIIFKTLSVLAVFCSKIDEYISIHQSIIDFKSPVDENSPEYCDKMQEIVTEIQSRNAKSKVSNSIRDSLGI